MTTVKQIGILGCGGIMQTIYSPILRSMTDQVRVAALCDLNPQNLQIASRLFPEATVYDNAEHLINSSELDAVMILTTERANAKMAELALRSDLTIYLEKPPAISLAEFDALLETEASASVRLFSAFNRRHTPLLRNFKLPNSPLRQVRGRMERLRRPVPSFPYTSIHLIDSAQFLVGETFTEARILFDQNPQAQWTVHGVWGSGATCALEFVPDGREHCEYLIFEGDDYSWEVEFPNCEGRLPAGKFVQRNGADTKSIATPGAEGNYLEEMGYAPSFRGFIKELSSENPPSEAYRLAASRTTISIMETMMPRKNSPLWTPSAPQHRLSEYSSA